MPPPRDGASGGAPRSLRVLTFNVLHDSMRGFMPSWERRRAAVAATVRALDPDVACFQEVSPRQLEHLREDLPDHDAVAGEPIETARRPRWIPDVSRAVRTVLGDSHETGEHCPTFFRRGALAVVDHAPIRRDDGRVVANRARLAGAAGPLVVANTHLAHAPWTALPVVDLLLSALRAEDDDAPRILTGDLNAMPNGPVLRRLLAPPPDGAPALRDAWTAAATRSGTPRTYHGSFGLPGPRIDYVLVAGVRAVTHAQTTTGRTNGVHPSDHCALVAELAF